MKEKKKNAESFILFSSFFRDKTVFTKKKLFVAEWNILHFY